MPAGPSATTFSGVRDYLVRFGYLGPDASGSAALAKALWGFQRLHRLPLTGVPDVMTVGIMHQLRCGQLDMTPPTPIPRLWSVAGLTCDITNTPDTLTLREVREACTEAAGGWQPHIPFGLHVGRGIGAVTVELRFVRGDHGDGCPVGGETGVLGHAFMLAGRGGRLCGEIHLDKGARWSLSPERDAGAVDLVAVLAHQLGHIFGLGHALSPGSVMHPVQRWGRRLPARQDIVALRDVQQVRPSLWQRITGRFQGS